MVNRTSSPPKSRYRAVQELIGLLILTSLSALGVSELFIGGAHRQHLLLIFLALFISGVVVLAAQLLRSRSALSEVRIANDRMQKALLAGNSVAWDIDVNTGVNRWFGDLKTMFGVASESMTLQIGDFYGYVHEDDRQRVAGAVAQAREEHSLYGCEFRIVHEDGTVRHVSATGEFEYSKNGDAVRMLGIGVDITEQRKAEEARTESEEKFSKGFHQSPIAMTLMSARTRRYLEVNDAFLRDSQWPRDEVIGRTPQELNLWVDLKEREELAEKIDTRRGVRDFELHFRRRDGTEGVGLASAELIQIADEPCILSAIVDITDRKRAEEELRHKERELADAQRLAHIGSWQYDVKQRSLSWSDELRRIHGLGSDDPAPSYDDFPKLFTGESWQVLRGTMARATEGGILPQVDLEIVRPDGTQRWVATHGKVIRDAAGDVVALSGTTQDITDRKRSEEALVRKEHDLAEAQRLAHIGSWEWDIETGVTRWSEELYRIYGLDPREPAPSIEQVQKLYTPESWSLLQQAIEARSFPDMELEFRRPDGSKGWVHARVESKTNSEGTIIKLRGVSRDITDEKRTEDQLHESEERLRQLIESSNDWIYETDRNGIYTYVHPKCRELLGYEPEELIGKKRPIDLMPGYESSRLNEQFELLFTEPEAFRGFRSARVRKDGRLIVLETSGVPIFDSKGRFRGHRGVVSDVTDRNQAEIDLRESEARFRRVVEHIGDALVVDDIAGRVVFANDQFLKVFGLRPEELDGITLETYVAPEYRADLRDRHNRRMRGEELGTRYEFRGLRRDGTHLWIQAEVVVVKDHEGNVVGSQRVLRDVTEQIRAEEALRESEERFRSVANTAPVMIWMSDTEDRCTYVNKTWLDFTGRKISQELGNGWRESIHPDDLRSFIERSGEGFENRSATEVQYRLRRHDGEFRWILDVGVPRFNNHGSFAGYIGSCIDITERKQAEEAMGTIGRRLIEAHEEERTWIGRELHDDINQRLALLSVELDRWLKNNRAHGPVRELIAHAQKRITELSKDIQNLSHRLHSSKLEYLGLAMAARSFCRELSEQSKAEVAFTHDGIPRSLPQEISLCLFRVLQESLQNAVKHSGVKHFTVDLRGSSDSIELTVMDTGHGFDLSEALKRQGLGLISMRERLQMVRGDLSIRSVLGAGTTIRARVPLENVETHALAG